MKTIKYIIPFLLISILSCNQEAHRDVEVRLGNFLVENTAINLKLTSERDHKSKILNYGELSSYIKIKPGIYEVEITADSKPILKKKFGFASGGKFSVFVYGTLANATQVNQTTSTSKLHQIVSGEEAHTTNGYLPQLRLLDDHYEGGNNTAQLRWVNLVPFEKSFKSESVSDSKTDFGTAAYGNTHKAQKFKEGNYTFSWNLKDSPIVRVEKKQAVVKKRLYTFFLIPNMGAYGSLRVVVGESSNK